MALRAVVIPFDGGHDTTVDKRLAGLARFRAVVNGRLDADGRIISRPRYQQLASTTYGEGTFAAYDLFDLDGRLCALGDRLGLGFATDVFEYIAAAAAWRPTDTASTSLPRLPRATGVRELPRPPDQEGGVSTFDVAAADGYVVLTYQQSGASARTFSQLIAAESGQTVLIERINTLTGPSDLTRAVGLATRLWLIGAPEARGDVVGRFIDPGSDTAWANAASALIGTANDVELVDAAKVGGADQLVVGMYDSGGNVVVRRFDSDGVVIAPSGGQYATITGVTAEQIAVEADTAGNSVNVAVNDGGTLKVYSYNLATGATLGAPPATPTAASGEDITKVSIVRATSTTVIVVATITTIGTPDVPRVYRWVYTTATQAFGSGFRVTDCRLTSHAVRPDAAGTVVYGVVRAGGTAADGGSPNMLIEHGAADDIMAPLVTKDLGIAEEPSAQLPHVGIDTSQTPTRYYWVAAVQSTDGGSIPVVCELRLNDPGRRQVARQGRGAIIAGGCPVWYDGMQLVELGFTQRPRVVSLTASNGAGELLPGATYNYAVMQSWTDALGRLHRSPVSVPVPVEMGATDDTVTAVVSTPLTLRYNDASAQYGSVPRSELYRTRTIQTLTAPALVSTATLDPPETSLDGLTLNVLTVVGTTADIDTVTFDSGDTSSAAIVATINGAFSGATASADGGFLVITANTGGANVGIAAAGTALEALGFDVGAHDQGSTETEFGAVLHLTATDYLSNGGAVGNRDTLVDTRNDGTADDELASQAVIYTQVESPLDDRAPPPADRVWAGNERVFVAGLPNRAAWRASKLVDAIRAPAFATEGRPGFGGELAESIEGLVVSDVSALLFTRHGVYQVDGEGPEENGQGGFAAARRLLTDGGLVTDGWRSLLETAAGVWAQFDDDKLYLLPPGGSPVWAGFAIRELLRSFPVIVAATLTHNDQMAAFALQSSDGTDGRIVLFDLRREVWYVDDVDAVPQALADYQGRLVYVADDQSVWMADASAGTGTFIPLTVTTGYATEFDVAGQGAVPDVLLVGELLGECTVALEVDYDDGAGYVTAGSFALTAANGYTVGQTVRLEFMLARQDTSSFSLRIATTGGADSAGLALVCLVVQADKDSGPALLGDRFRR